MSRRKTTIQRAPYQSPLDALTAPKSNTTEYGCWTLDDGNEGRPVMVLKAETIEDAVERYIRVHVKRGVFAGVIRFAVNTIDEVHEIEATIRPGSRPSYEFV